MRWYIDDLILGERDIDSWAKAVIATKGESYLTTIATTYLSWIDDSKVITAYTSGSTGSPKLITHSKSSVVTSVHKTAQRFGLKPGMTILHNLPAQYIAGKIMLIRALVLDMDVVLTAPKLHMTIPTGHHYNFVAMTPLQMTYCLDIQPECIAHMDKIILGGAPVPHDLEDRLQDVPAEVYATYGMTETITHIATRPLNGPFRSPLYQPLDGVMISISEAHTLIITSDHLPGPIHTHDLVTIIDEHHFHILGRADDVINRGGVKLHPVLIESKLSSVLPYPFFIAAIDDDMAGQSPCLVIAKDNESDDTTIIDKAIQLLDKLERPQKVMIVPKLVYTPSGKIIKDLSYYR